MKTIMLWKSLKQNMSPQPARSDLENPPRVGVGLQNRGSTPAQPRLNPLPGSLSDAQPFSKILIQIICASQNVAFRGLWEGVVRKAGADSGVCPDVITGNRHSLGGDSRKAPVGSTLTFHFFMPVTNVFAYMSLVCSVAVHSQHGLGMSQHWSQSSGPYRGAHGGPPTWAYT